MDVKREGEKEMPTKCLSIFPTEWVKGKVIGSGSYGTVHLAMSKATGALFVVKSAQRLSGGAGPDQSLENEADILESLDSPFVVKCIGRELSIGADGEQKVDVFMEYMAGGSLADVSEKFGGMLDEEVIRLYTREILHGLNYLHENGIVHCDLKCKNVLLCASGSIKLADFGCAKRVKDLNGNGVSLKQSSIGGTPLWMAPEVLRNEGLDFASDIWSLGCTVIEMATGKPPWDGEVSNPVAAVLKIACSNETPRLPTQFSKEGLDFLAKCLERDPKKRWTSRELLEHPFVSRSSRKEFASSPASVLDIAIYEEEDYDSDESCGGCGGGGSGCGGGGSEFSSRNPFSSRIFSEGKRRDHRRHGGDSDSMTSENNWITVRSG